MAIKTEWRDPNGLTGISCLSSDTKPDAPAGSICWETDTGNRFERDGDTWQPSGTGGAAHVTNRDGVTQTAIREYDGDPGATTRELTFVRGAHNITITVDALAVVTAAAIPAVRVVFNQNPAQGAVSLAAVDSGQFGEQQYYVVKHGQPRKFEFDTTHERIYNVLLQTDVGAVTKVTVEGERNED